MKSTMMDVPLSLTNLALYSTTAHGDGRVLTWTGTGSRSCSYGELGGRIARLAGALRALGVDGDQRVGTFCWNNQEHLEAYLAVPAMGAVLHPINIRLFPEQLVYVVNHAEDEVVIVDGTLAEPFGRLLPKLPCVRHVLVTGDADLATVAADGVEVHRYADALAAAEPTFPWPEIDERQAAGMCYTSGTTGNPKGVVYSHRSTYLHSSALARGDVAALSQDDRVLPVVPMFHANAWGLPYASVLVGADLLMPDRFLQGEPLAAMIEAERPTVAGAVPTIWTGLLQHARGAGTDLSSLRKVICGGSAVPRSLMLAYEQEFGVTVRHAWGMTETSPLASTAFPPQELTGEEALRCRLSQGRILPEVQYRLVGGDGSVVPNDGESLGELEVRGPWVTESYYREDSPEKFQDGWLRTGDVGTVDERGFFTITDRAKDVIKSGGEWISSVDMENALMAHAGVFEAAVIAIPDETWSERPLACVVAAADATPDPQELRESLRAEFAGWQLPDQFTFVDEIPKTSVGKFDKKVLRQRYADDELEIRQVAHG
ncbi:MAG: long-chain-fatty-acid--CoA ligase [Streptosporangiales bacterium]|nr:long-chain-fatty-acid--CoA ligase [Streptosporangiales bacterium]